MSKLDKTLGFVVAGRKGRFTAMIAEAYESEGDSDSFLHVLGIKGGFTELAEAQGFLVANAPPNSVLFKNPVKLGTPGMIWLSELTSANPEVVL
jgi:hypothetical protein